MITRLLINWTPSQIYGFIWQAVRRADNNRTRNVWGNYKYHQVDFVIKIIDDIIINKNSLDIPTDKYKYPFQVTPFFKTKIFFNQMIVNPDWFQKAVPMNSNDNLRTIPLKAMKKTIEKQENDISKLVPIIKNAKWYSISNLGIIVFDGENERLFSNEITIYSIYSSFKSDWLKQAENDFLFNKFYSFSFLSSLQTLLEKSDIKRKDIFN